MSVTEKELGKIRDYLNSDGFRKNQAILRAISGNVRYKIVGALNQSKDGLTVSELAKLFGYSISRVSHQLRILRKYKIVTMNRDGKSMVYQMTDNQFLRQLIEKWRSNAYKKI